MYLIDIILTRVLLLYERLAAQLCVQKKEVCFVSPFDTDCIFPTVFSFLFGLKCYLLCLFIVMHVQFATCLISGVR